MHKFEVSYSYSFVSDKLTVEKIQEVEAYGRSLVPDDYQTTFSMSDFTRTYHGGRKVWVWWVDVTMHVSHGSNKL